MNPLIVLVGSLLVLQAYAQPNEGMDPEQMQEMMAKMAQMQECYSQLDQAELQNLGNEAKVMEAELRQLCASGERSQAQERAIAFGSSVAAKPAMRQLRQCAELAKGMMPMGQMPEMKDFTDPEKLKNRHVCDQL